MAWGILDHVKERLTGAIILVALIVLLVPELLTGPIRMKSAPGAAAAKASPQVARAATAEAPLRSYTLTLGAPPPPEAAAAPAPTAPVQPAKSLPQIPAQSSATSSADGGREGLNSGEDAHESNVPQAATAANDAVAIAQLPRPQPGSRAVPRLQPAKSPAYSALREARSPASSTGWVVQLGSFASRQNADRLAHALAGRGVHMSVSPARAGSRVLWRVRAGPAHDRAGAERLAARLRALGHRGELLPVR